MLSSNQELQKKTKIHFFDRGSNQWKQQQKNDDSTSKIVELTKRSIVIRITFNGNRAKLMLSLNVVSLSFSNVKLSINSARKDNMDRGSAVQYESTKERFYDDDE